MLGRTSRWVAAYLLSLSVTITRGTYRKPFSSLRKNRLAAVALRRLWTRMSRTCPSPVDPTPKIALLAADADEHLVHVPLVTGLWPSLPQHNGEDPAKARAPLADTLVADDGPTCRQDPLNISQAQTEAVIKADGMLDDFAREAEAAIRI